MRILSFNFSTKLQFSQPVVDHDFVLRCMPRSSSRQTVLTSDITVFPATTLARQTDGFGNALLAGRIPEGHDEFEFYSLGEVMVDESRQNGGRDFFADGPQSPVFARPSSLTCAGEAVRALVEETLSISFNAGACAEGGLALERARLLSAAVSARMTYAPGATDVHTTGEQALAGGAGVCQDYSHALLAACRLAGIPARYVSGLMLGEGATHSWVDVLCEDGWHGLDPTNARDVTDDYIVLGYGRDFGDCPIERGVFRGDAEQVQSVQVSVTDDASTSPSA
jgi:transglutaminase-like putative cysteine protease